MGPKLSIVTASFNQAIYLERTIRSIIEQSYQNFELIIIDGGSNDGSVEVIKKYEKHIAYWVSEKDNGQTHAINKGFERSTGDFVCFQNSDDIFYPGAFGAFVEEIKRYPNRDLFYGNLKHIDKDDEEISVQKLMPVNYFMQVFKGPLIHNQACFWKRDIFDAVGFLDESYDFDMDYEFFSRVLLGNFQTRFIPKYLGAFRHHELAKTSNLQDVSKAEKQKVKDVYKAKRFITKVVPFPVGRLTGTCVKVLYHLVNLDVGYLIRKK